MEALQKEFTDSLQQRKAELKAAWSLLFNGAGDEGHFKIFHNNVHKLSGTCSMYGFPQTGEAARLLDEWLMNKVENPGTSISFKELGGNEEAVSLVATLLALLEDPT